MSRRCALYRLDTTVQPYPLYRVSCASCELPLKIAGYNRPMVQRLTKPTARVLNVLLEAPQGRSYGLELTEQAAVGAGTLYPMLTRLESIGWLESTWEAIDATEAGRPPRRYYKLTGAGRVDAVAALERGAATGNRGVAEA